MVSQSGTSRRLGADELLEHHERDARFAADLGQNALHARPVEPARAGADARQPDTLDPRVRSELDHPAGRPGERRELRSLLPVLLHREVIDDLVALVPDEHVAEMEAAVGAAQT